MHDCVGTFPTLPRPRTTPNLTYLAEPPWNCPRYVNQRRYFTNAVNERTNRRIRRWLSDVPAELTSTTVRCLAHVSGVTGSWLLIDLTLVKNERRYCTNVVNEPTNRADQTLAYRRTGLDNPQASYDKKKQKEKLCDHVGSATDKRAYGIG
jgi:hypothetical protein